MRILLVEDDVTLGPQLQQALKKAGFSVDISQEGLDAEALGDIEPYDLAVLDLGLPNKNGLEVLKSWRSRSNQLPVIILTARGSWLEKVEGFKAGADDYVGKPFQFDELLARVNAVLKRSVGATSGHLSTQHFTLDESRQCIQLQDGKIQPLTGTEFKLLRYFMLHPGQVLSKSRLTEHIYEYDEDKDSNIIEVYVNRLRHLIGSDLIKTRRGQGYVFGDDAQ